MISLFVPVYNEEAILEANVGKVLDTLQEYDLELFIVDDGSSDKSGDIGKRLAASDRRIRYLRYDSGPSRRENLAASFGEAGGEYVGFIDADLSVGPEYVPGMVSGLRDADLVISSKYLPGSSIKRGLVRNIWGRLSNTFIKLYFGSRLSDHQCGLKFFRKDVLQKLVESAGYDSSFRRGFSWDAEVLVRAQRMGYRIAEVPVKWVESAKSSVSYGRELKMVPYMVALRFRL